MAENIVLNKKQTIAKKLLREFIKQKEHKKFYLFGYAGTGKTYTVSNMIFEFLKEHVLHHVYVCAPTHQALNVIETYFRSVVKQEDMLTLETDISFLTMHKLLDFRPIIKNEDGTKVFRSTKESKFMKHLDERLIIIDECSMISKVMIAEINKYIELYPIKILFMGDAAQLPPVSEPISKIFTEVKPDYPYYLILDEIMRTNSSDIKEISMIVREWNKKDPLGPQLLDIHKRVSVPKTFKLFHSNPILKNATWFKKFIKDVENDKFPIILTWRNNPAELYNDTIRKIVHNREDVGDYITDDHLMFSNFYAVPGKICNVFYTSDMIRILKIKTTKLKLFDWSTLLIADSDHLVDKAYNRMINSFIKIDNEIEIDKMTVQKIYSNISIEDIGKKSNIQTVRLSAQKKYLEYVDRIRSDIESFFKQFKHDNHSSKLWETYHKYLIDPFAKLNFGYSITVHKSQGSTFKSVYVDVVDITSNPIDDEMQKSLYTASTRASEELYFIVG